MYNKNLNHFAILRNAFRKFYKSPSTSLQIIGIRFGIAGSIFTIIFSIASFWLAIMVKNNNKLLIKTDSVLQQLIIENNQLNSISQPKIIITLPII